MRFLALVGALAIAAAIAAAGFFFGGFFNLSAMDQDPPAIASAIVRVRTASIARHATDRMPANFAELTRVQSGAKLFSTLGCVNCHGAPGVKWAKFSEGLNPDPPDLKEEAGGLSPSEVFWIVKNGIRMTGMPSFGAIGVADDDIWSVAAFVKGIAAISEADYKTWTTPPETAPAAIAPGAPAPAEKIAPPLTQPAPAAPPATDQAPKQ